MTLPPLPFYLFILRALHTRAHSDTQDSAGKLGNGISAMGLTKFKIFSLLLSLFSLLLFGWISAMPLPKFSLSPQFSNYLWTVRITQINFEFYNINPKDSIKGGFWMESLALGAEPWIFCLGAKTIKLKNIWCSNQNYITTIPINKSSKEIE